MTVRLHHKIGDSERRYLKFLAEAGEPINARQVYRGLFVSNTTAYKHLNSLHKLGFAFKRPDGRWHITQRGVDALHAEADSYLNNAAFWTKKSDEVRLTANQGQEQVDDRNRG